jgi:hypothetical protein
MHVCKTPGCGQDRFATRQAAASMSECAGPFGQEQFAAWQEHFAGLWSTEDAGTPLEDPMGNNKPTKLASSPAEAARQIFRESPYAAIRELQCSVRDGVLFIAGRVPNYYLKQLAQIALVNLEGIKQVRNLVEVSE